MSLLQNQFHGLKKCYRYNRIQKPKVQNLEAKHTHLFRVFHVQEMIQLELGRQLN